MYFPKLFPCLWSKPDLIFKVMQGDFCKMQILCCLFSKIPQCFPRAYKIKEVKLCVLCIPGKNITVFWINHDRRMNYFSICFMENMEFFVTHKQYLAKKVGKKYYRGASDS